MKHILCVVAGILFYLNVDSQVRMYARVHPAKPGSIQLKWYTTEFVTDQEYFLYRKSETEDWTRINSETIRFQAYKIPADSFMTDKELKNYIAMCQSSSKIKDLIKLATVLKSFRSFEFSKFLGIAYADNSVKPGTMYEYQLRNSTSVVLAFGQLAAGVYKAIAKPDSFYAARTKNVVKFKWFPEPNRFYGVNLYRKENGSDAKKINQDVIVLSTSKNSKGQDVFPPFYYEDRNIEQGRLYSYFIRAVDFFGGESSPSATVQINYGDEEPPPMPDSIRTVLNGKQVRLNWRLTNPPSDLKGFNVYTTIRNDTDFVKITDEVVTTTQYEHKSHRYGSFMFKIGAIDFSGNERISDPVYVEVYDAEPPAAPRNLAVHSDTGRIILTWNRNTEDDINGYIVYRTVNSDDKESYVKYTPTPIKDTVFTDSLQKNIRNKFYYKLVAVDLNMNKSGYSIPVNASMPDVVAPSSPFVEAAQTDKFGHVNINWLSNPEPDLSFYSLYRGSDTTGVVKINPKPLTRERNSFVDRSVVASKSYTYYLTATDSSGNESKASNHFSIKVKAIQPEPMEIRGLSARFKKNAGEVIIQWEIENPSELKGSMVYRSVDNGDLVAVSGLIESMVFHDKSVTRNGNYRYQVRVYNNAGDIVRSELIKIITQ